MVANPGNDSTHLTFAQKLTWSIGALANNVLANGLGNLALPIYTIALGVSPVLLSFALAIPRLWDAFTDPLMGNISDNTRSKWGRRRPYIAAGIIASGISFALLWIPPTRLSHMGLFAYFLVMSIVYFTAYTVFAVPWGAMGLELTESYNERTRVMAYRAFFNGLCSALLLPWLYKLCFVFSDNEVEGVKYVGLLVGVFVIFIGLIPAIWGKENIKAQSQAKIPLMDAFKYTFKNKVFILLAMIILPLLVGVFMVRPFGTFINIYYVAQGDKSMGAKLIGFGGAVLGIAGILSAPLISFAGTHIGKKTTLILGQILVLIASLATWFLYTPEYPYLQLVYFAISFPGMSCMLILGSSMLADLCDIDELKTGLRREGMYGAVYAWIFKVGVSGVVALSGFMVEWSGYDAKLEQQEPQTIFTMRLLWAIVPAACMAVSIILTALYPISKKKMQEVRATLDERKKGQ